MDDSSEMLHQIGSFEPADAKKILEALEAEGIEFEADADNTALFEAGRGALLSIGMSPEGSKLAVFVRESDLDRATELVKRLFPQE